MNNLNPRPLGGLNDPAIMVEPNQAPDCFSIRCGPPGPAASFDEDLIHFCDWPAMKATIDAYQRERGGRT